MVWLDRLKIPVALYRPSHPVFLSVMYKIIKVVVDGWEVCMETMLVIRQVSHVQSFSWPG